MQLAWTHLLPATFGGRAKMNVQNAHGGSRLRRSPPARTCTTSGRACARSRTSYYLSPGRLNQIEVGGATVIVDYCHNAPGMRLLGDFVEQLADSAPRQTSELAKPAADRRGRDRG